MKVTIFLLFAIGACVAEVPNFFEIPRKTTLEMIDRNERVLEDILNDIKSDKMSAAYDAFHNGTTPFIKKQDEKYSKMQAENRELFASSNKLAEDKKINIEDCIKIRDERLGKYIPSFYINMIINCLRLHTNEPRTMWSAEYLQENVTMLKKNNNMAKQQLETCISDKKDNSEIMECLLKIRETVQKSLSFEIMPLKREVSELPNYMKSTVSNARICTDNNPMLKTFWEKVEELETKYKNCITEKLGKI